MLFPCRSLVFALALSLLASPVSSQEAEALVDELQKLVAAGNYARLEAFDWDGLKKAQVDWFIREYNPLSLAVEKEDFPMIAYLLGKGFPGHYESGQDQESFLSTAIGEGRTEAVRRLLKAGLRPLSNDLYRCAGDSHLEILKLLLPFIEEPVARRKILEWGEPSGGTNSYLRFLAEQSGTERILAFLVTAYPGSVDVVYSNYSAVFKPWMLRHFTLADLAGERLASILPSFKGRRASEILNSTPYKELKGVFANSFTARTSDRLRLRASPALSATVVTTLDAGSELRVIEIDAETGPEEIDGLPSAWHFVVTPSLKRGWVWGGYLEYTSMP